MNCPFNKNHSRNFSRFLSVTLAALMIAAMFTGCQNKESPLDNSEPLESLTPPNLVESAEPPVETEPTTPPSTEPEKSNVAIVKDQINVRSSPSAESNVIGQLDAGDEVEINRIETVSGIQWAYIPLKGWVTIDNLDMSNVTTPANPSVGTPANPEATEAPETTAPPVAENNNNNNDSGNGQKGVVTAQNLNIRSQANTTSDVVGSLGYGARVSIQETSNGWGKIKDGWISLNYVYLDGNKGTNTCNGFISGSQLNVRSGPGTNYEAVGSLSKGDRVNVLEQIKVGNTTWGCIKNGWISMDYVFVDGTKDAETSGTGTVTADGVNIRKGPGTNYEAVAVANSGDTFEITSQMTSGNMTWGCTSKGWISMNYIEMD